MSRISEAIRSPLVNAFNDETFHFTRLDGSGGSAEFEVVLGPGGSGGANGLMHLHPKADETFMVRSGELKVCIDGTMHAVKAGQAITIPRGRPHYFMNGSDGQTRAALRFTPAQQHLRFFYNFGRTVEERPEWFNDKGEPDLLHMAQVLHAYAGHLYVAGPPVWLQRLVFALLAPFAWVAGYRVLVKPERGARG